MCCTSLPRVPHVVGRGKKFWAVQNFLPRPTPLQFLYVLNKAVSLCCHFFSQVFCSGAEESLARTRRRMRGVHFIYFILFIYRDLRGSIRDVGPAGPATRGAVWATRNCQSRCGVGAGQILQMRVRVEVFCG